MNVRFLTSGNITFNEQKDLDVFIVGAGGASKRHYLGSDTWTCCKGDSGAYSKFTYTPTKGTSYSFKVGTSSDKKTYAFSSDKYTVSGGKNGDGDSIECYNNTDREFSYAFNETSGKIKYSTMGDNPPSENTGGGAGCENGYGGYSMNGASGVIIIRNKR